MRKWLTVAMAIALMVALLPGGVASAADSYPLIAGQNTQVGTVTVDDDGTNLTVSYDITVEDWFLTKAHAYVDVREPRKAAPGSFPFNSGPIDATSYTFTIPLEDLGVESGEELFVAAHALVQHRSDEYIIGYDCPTLDEIAAALPGSVNIVAGNYPNNSSYFDVTVSGGTGLDGTYGAFCIDATHTIYLGSNYTANVWSSYEPLPDTMTTGTDPNIDKPENLDLVNWVINQDFLSQGFSSADIQNAIWNLIDDNPPACNEACTAIVNAAYANGEGFVPGFGDVLAVILQPVDGSGNTSGQVTVAQVTIAQVTLFGLGLECTPIYSDDSFETGWAFAGGDAIPFRTGWGSYFSYATTELSAG